MTPIHHAPDRDVFTYQPDGWPLGVLTGYADGQGGFVLEHMIVFAYAPMTTLVRMLRAGLEEAWARDYASVRFTLPHGFPLASHLDRIGRRLGFAADAQTQDATRYVCRRAA